MTQEEKVLEHLKKHGSITTWDAFTLYRITRLSAYIYNLRHNKGFKIVSIEEKKGDGARWVRYTLEDE